MKAAGFLAVLTLFTCASAWATTPTKVEVNFIPVMLPNTAPTQQQARCPRAAASGDAEFVFLANPSSSSDEVSAIADYPSGSNTWVKDKTESDSTNGSTGYILRANNVASGSRGATITFSAGQGVTAAACILMNNINTGATPTDGTCGAANVTPSSSMACGSSVGAAGDEMLVCAFDVATTTGSSYPQFTAGSGFTLIGVDNAGIAACEIGNLSSATNPTIGVSTNTTGKYIVVGVAYKTASAGGSAPTVPYAPSELSFDLNDYPLIYSAALSGTSFTINAPCPSGTDALDIVMTNNVSSSFVTGVTASNPTLTFTVTTASSNGGVIFVQHAYATGVSGCGSTTTITFTLSATPGAASNGFAGTVFALQNAGGGLDTSFGSSGLCNSNGSNSSTSFPVSITNTSCTTSAANELLISQQQENDQTVTSSSASSGTIYDLEPDVGQYAEYSGFQDAGAAAVYMGSAGSNAITWTYKKYDSGSTTIGPWAAQTLAWEPSGSGVFEDDSWSGPAPQASAATITVWGFIFGLMLAGATLAYPWILGGPNGSADSTRRSHGAELHLERAVDRGRIVDGPVRASQAEWPTLTAVLQDSGPEGAVYVVQEAGGRKAPPGEAQS